MEIVNFTLWPSLTGGLLIGIAAVMLMYFNGKVAGISGITKGIISGYRDFNGVRLIQTDVSINEGSSGGPLLNENGKVLGMATMKAKGTGIEGIGFGIPASIILEKLNIRYK